MSERRREDLGTDDLDKLTSPEVMQAAQPEGEEAWRGDARPAFRDLLEAETDEETDGG